TREGSFEETEFGTHKFGYGRQLTTDGIVSASLDVTLPKNAVVRRFDVIVKALRATATVVESVAQVRAQDSLIGTSAVVDFGTPRTVSAGRVPDGLQIVNITAWTGAAFGTTAIYAALVASRAGSPLSGERREDTFVTARPPSTSTTAIFDSEVRTERLLVDMVGAADAGEISSGMAVVLPEAPQGLELRIDGAQPVFTDNGPVSPGD